MSVQYCIEPKSGSERCVSQVGVRKVVWAGSKTQSAAARRFVSMRAVDLTALILHSNEISVTYTVLKIRTISNALP